MVHQPRENVRSERARHKSTLFCHLKDCPAGSDSCYFCIQYSLIKLRHGVAELLIKKPSIATEYFKIPALNFWKIRIGL